jgi:hypothetical protein
MKPEQLSDITNTLKEKYPEVGIRSIEVNENTGQSTFYIEPTRKSLAFIEERKGGGVVPRVSNKERAATITRDYVQRTNLDLLMQSPDPYTQDPIEVYKRAIRYYYTDPMLGSAVNLLASLARKGFENDIDDPNIKQFYDVWCFDCNFDELLEWIFLDFFKVGQVTTYKVLAAYQPRVSYLSPVPGQKMKNSPKKKSAGLETAAKKNIWSKGHLPVSFTVLNPTLVTITGNLLFDNVSTQLTIPQELTQLLKKQGSELTDEEKLLIKALPSDLKNAADKGGAYQLNETLVGHINYRKQPYERYAKPRSMRVFDTIEYKTALREADLSTLDGISNYILKVTIGNDEYPVTTQAELEAVSALFNTPSKSFDVVWNHTLNIEKIVSPEIESILGKGKYEQVNDDMTTGLSIARALIDGGGQLGSGAVELLTKGLTEEVEYARRQVTRWIYREYQQIAEAMGFDRFPKIRWDEGILLDTILYMNTLGQLVDRRMLSYRTSLEALGFDYPTELEHMQTELPLVEDGVFGILGSPWQQAKMGAPGAAGPAGPAPSAPAKAPPSGPPKGTQKNKNVQTQTTPKKSATSPNQQKKNQQVKQAASIDMNVVVDMSASEYAAFLDGARTVLDDEEYVNFVEESAKHRFLRR